ncbi:MAG: hypothetical protein MJ114_09445 [Acetatifactor sp.]|nr:hypothetical protein [Acetatifactor sp.]
MQTLYESDNRGILLYTKDQEIILRYKNADIFESPVILEKDHAGDLCHCVYRGSIHYAYRTLSGAIRINKVSPDPPELLIDLPEAVHIRSLQLLVSDGRLLLCFLSASEKTNDLTLYLHLPYEKKRLTAYSLGSCEPYPDISVLSLSAKLIILLITGARLRILNVAPSGTVSEQTLIEQQVIHRISQLETENKMLRRTLSSAQTQYNELMQVAEQYRQEAIKWSSKFR